jgi:hypothetical protein
MVRFSRPSPARARTGSATMPDAASVAIADDHTLAASGDNRHEVQIASRSCSLCGQRAWEPEVREHAAVGEEGDLGDVAAGEREHE